MRRVVVTGAAGVTALGNDWRDGNPHHGRLGAV